MDQSIRVFITYEQALLKYISRNSVREMAKGLRGGGRNLSILRLCPFQYDVGPMLLVEGKESLIKLPALVFKYPCCHLHTGRLQLFNTLAIYFYERIAATNNHPLNIFLNDQVSTGRCFAEVGTWFQ